MRVMILTLAAGLALSAAPLELQAQNRGRSGEAKGAVERDRGRTDGRIDPRDILGGRTVQQRQGNGPPFCANGQGHPVHGMRWCRDKGWTTGIALPRWERAPWDDVILRNPRRAERGSVSGSVLEDILGGVIFGRVDAHRRALGLTEPLSGQWFTEGGGHVLRLHAGGMPIAEFIDQNRNNRADTVRLNRGR